MRLLLDTHVLIWWDAGARLSREARNAIRDADEVYVSAASAWEIAIKTALGRIVTSRTVGDAVQASGFIELPILFRHAGALGALPPLHRDPFDRLLVAQAHVEKLTIVTRDALFSQYAVKVIRA